VETVVLRDPAAVELAEYIKAHTIDLVVMTSHGRSGLPRLLLGSTAERLVHSGTPVLIVHPDPGAADIAGSAAAVEPVAHR
jgi:nucleotide-binding universal stress UspA family protein